MYRGVKDGKDVIVCQVGNTTLLYDARCIEDLHAMLKAHGDWMDLGGADEQKNLSPVRSKPGGVRRKTLWLAGTG